MLELVTHPPDLDTWEPCGNTPYLELYGETSPLLEQDHPEALVAAAGDAAPQLMTGGQIYEYSWTLGLPEAWCVGDGSSLLGHVSHRDDDIAAQVYLYFPRSGGWRIAEIMATVKYLRPLPHQEELVAKVAQYWQAAAPIAEEASKIARLVAGPVVAGPAIMLGMLTKLHLSALPPIEGFELSVERITARVGTEALEGVRWTLPRSMFAILGHRLTGSIAVAFQPVALQRDGVATTRRATPEPRAIRARAIVYLGQDERAVPMPQEETVALQIAPRLSE